LAEWPLSTPEYIRLDLFPAYVTRAGAVGPYTDRARVIITDRDFYVFLDAPGGPVCDLSGALFDASGTNRTGYTVELEDGTVYAVSRAQNCGCGSILRGFRPFPGVPYRGL
jgi:hypothetical protein